MATAEQTDTEPLNQSTLAREISKGIADGIAETRPKRLTYGQYVAREARRHPKPALKCSFAQNGYELRHETLTAEEISWLNRITRGGRYFDRKVEVVYKDESGDVSVNFVYPNKTIDQRMDLPFKGLINLVRPIVEQQEAEDAAEADQLAAARKRR